MTSAAISLREISMSYGKKPVLKGITLEVFAGEIFGLIGSNGSGKSTLLRIIAGTLEPTHGTVNKNGGCGFVPQPFALYGDLSVEENIAFFGKCSGLAGPALQATVEDVIRRIGLVALRGERTERLSHGWRQRLKLAVALCRKPSVLLLDEATAGVDPAARKAMWGIFSDYAESGGAVLLATHYMDEVPRCSRSARLEDGSLVYDSPSLQDSHKSILPLADPSGGELL